MEDPRKFAFLDVYQQGSPVPVGQRISNAMEDLRQQNQHLTNPPAYGTPPAPGPDGTVPLPKRRPNVEQIAAALAGAPRPAAGQMPIGMQPGQPMNIMPDNVQAMNFAGAKGPQWTDAQFQNFWNRVGNNG